MNLEKLKTTVETVSNVALILVSVVFLAMLASAYISKPGAEQLKTGLQRGQKFADFPHVDYQNSENTLLLFLNTECEYCRTSFPFYQQLIEARRLRGGNTRIVSVFPNSSEEAAQYMKRNQLPVEVVASVNFNEINLTGTPTMVLLDRAGVVKDFWVGKIPEKEEAQVINSLFSERVSMR